MLFEMKFDTQLWVGKTLYGAHFEDIHRGADTPEIAIAIIKSKYLGARNITATFTNIIPFEQDGIRMI